MNKLFYLLLFLSISLASQAKVYNISITSNAFTPNQQNAEIGDTIRFSLVNGFHSVVSVSVPSGATIFNSGTMSTAGTTFDLVLTHSGSYSYKCGIHSTMTGTITVNTPSVVDDSYSDFIAYGVYPNPFEDFFTFENPTEEIVTLEIYDMNGLLVYTGQYGTGTSTINVSNLPGGIYQVIIRSKIGTATKKLKAR